jgi:cytoskeletal protein CcmA (bactofilin family)
MKMAPTRVQLHSQARTIEPMSRMVRLGAAILMLVLLLVLAAGMTLGKGLLGGKLRTDRTLVVPAGEHVKGDLYLFAGNITVEGTVDGDLLAMGGDVRVSGTVDGDLIAAGGTVTIDGTVKGDARVAAGQLTVTGKVGEDLVIASGDASVESNAKVGEDLILAAGTAAMDGSVGGSIEGSAGTYSRSGTVGGSEHVTIGRAGGGEPAPRRTAADAIGDAIRHFVVVLLFGVLGLWLLPRAMRAAEELVRRRPLPSLGVGLLVFVVYVVGAVALVLLVILLAILFGLLTLGSLAAIAFFAGLLLLLVATFALVIAASFIADAVVGLALARLASPSQGGSRWREIGLLAVGAAVVVAVSSLPVLGWAVKLAVALVGIGAIALAAWNARRAMPASGAPAGATATTPEIAATE